MADVNWKSIGGISIIGGLIGYIGAWNKDRRYKNKFGVFDAEKRQEISELVCVVCGIKDEIANYNWDEDAKGCCGRGVQEKRYFQYGADESFSAEEKQPFIVYGEYKNGQRRKVGQSATARGAKKIVADKEKAGILNYDKYKDYGFYQQGERGVFNNPVQRMVGPKTWKQVKKYLMKNDYGQYVMNESYRWWPPVYVEYVEVPYHKWRPRFGKKIDDLIYNKIAEKDGEFSIQGSDDLLEGEILMVSKNAHKVMPHIPYFDIDGPKVTYTVKELKEKMKSLGVGEKHPNGLEQMKAQLFNFKGGVYDGWYILHGIMRLPLNTEIVLQTMKDGNWPLFMSFNYKDEDYIIILMPNRIWGMVDFMKDYKYQGAESFSAEEDYCDDCGSTDNVCAVTDLCDDCMDSAGYDWDGRNRPNECLHCGEMDSMYINESRWECYECKKLAYDAESFSAESQFGDPEWKTKVHANNDGKPCKWLNGRLSWDISYYTPLGRTFRGDISKNPKEKSEGYTVWISCDNLGGCGGDRRMGISPKLLNLTKFKTMPQVKKAFKKFIDDLFTGKMKCQEGGETLTDETIAHCSGCDIWDSNDMTRNGYVCHHHLYTSDRIPPLMVFDDGRTVKSYDCKKHIKEAIWMEENPNDNEYVVGGKTISDSDLIPKEKYLNPRERMMRQRFGLGAEETNSCHRCGVAEKYTKLWWVGSRKGYICGKCSKGGKKYRAESKKTNKMGDLVYDAFYSPDSEVYQYIDAIHEHKRAHGLPLDKPRGVSSVNIIVFRTYLEGKAKTLERIGADKFNKKSIRGKVNVVNRAHNKSRKQQGAYLRALKQWIKDNTIYDYDIYKNANAFVSYKDKVFLAWGGYEHGGATITIEFTQSGDAKFNKMREGLPKEKRKEVVRIQYGAETFEAPMKGAQPPRNKYEAALHLDKTHTSAIRKALKDNYKDFNFSVKMNGNTTIVINLKSGKREINDWDSMETEINNLAIDTIWEMEKGDVDSIYGGFNTKDEMEISVYSFLGAFGNKEYIVKNAESKKTNEMDKFFEWILKENPTSRQTTKPYSRKVDYLAQRYSDEELKAGLINAFKAGDINHAKLFAAALGRQGFIRAYQTETFMNADTDNVGDFPCPICGGDTDDEFGRPCDKCKWKNVKKEKDIEIIKESKWMKGRRWKEITTNQNNLFRVLVGKPYNDEYADQWAWALHDVNGFLIRDFDGGWDTQKEALKSAKNYIIEWEQMSHYAKKFIIQNQYNTKSIRKGYE